MDNTGARRKIALIRFKPQQSSITIDPLLLIAGPGSGKTYTLVERIVRLISEHKVAPEKMFILTVTDKAAGELKTRVSNRLSESGVKSQSERNVVGNISLDLFANFRRILGIYASAKKFHFAG